jgi:hypothetical protein
MTGVNDYLDEIKSYATSYVTFGDGAKGEIVGIGKLAKEGLPKLDNVLLVKGLTANLISISQLCDQGLEVKFTKSECLVTNVLGEMMMKGIRSKENCYVWMSLEGDNHSTGSSDEKEETRKQIKKSQYKLPLLASPKNLTQHQNELINAIRAGINSLHLDCLKDVESNAAASSSQKKSLWGLQKEPNNTREALENEGWVEAMQDELIQLKRSEVWTLVPRLEGIYVMEAKWTFKIISEEDGAVLRKQARLVIHGDTQSRQDSCFR